MTTWPPARRTRRHSARAEAGSGTCSSTSVTLIASKAPFLERSEEHTSEPSHANISYAVFCLKKKNADGVAILSHSSVADVNIAVANGKILASQKLHRNIGPAYIVIERLKADGRVGVAELVVKY